jgi:hypothetical protein
VAASPASDNGVSFSESGAVSGTPAADGDSTFHVNVEDSSVPPLSASGDVTLHSATPAV